MLVRSNTLTAHSGHGILIWTSKNSGSLQLLRELWHNLIESTQLEERVDKQSLATKSQTAPPFPYLPPVSAVAVWQIRIWLAVAEEIGRARSLWSFSQELSLWQTARVRQCVDVWRQCGGGVAPPGSPSAIPERMAAQCGWSCAWLTSAPQRFVAVSVWLRLSSADKCTWIRSSVFFWEDLRWQQSVPKCCSKKNFDHIIIFWHKNAALMQSLDSHSILSFQQNYILSVNGMNVV